MRNTFDIYARSHVPNLAKDATVTIASAPARVTVRGGQDPSASSGAAAAAAAGVEASNKDDEHAVETESSSDDDVAPLNQSLGLEEKEASKAKESGRKNAKVVTEDETMAQASELQNKFSEMTGPEDTSITEKMIADMITESTNAGKSLRKKQMISLSKQAVETSKHLACAKSILAKAIAVSKAGRKKVATTGAALLKTTDDACTRYDFALRTLPSWILVQYYGQKSLKVFSDENLTRAMGVLSMTRLRSSFSEGQAGDLQCQSLTKVYYKFLSGLDDVCAADQLKALREAADSTANYGCSKADFEICSDNQTKLKHWHNLLHHESLPIAEVAESYTWIKQQASAPTTAFFVCMCFPLALHRCHDACIHSFLPSCVCNNAKE